MPERTQQEAPTLIQTWFPHHYTQGFQRSPDTLWLRLTPKTFRPDVEAQTDTNTNGKYYHNSALHFLMPKTFSFGIDHEWADVTTITGAIREVKTQFQKATANLSSFTNLGVGNIYAGGATVKNDNAMVYSNSSRRKLSLELNFGTYSSAKHEVWNPIQALILWSAADKAKGAYTTDTYFPYVFKVQTVDGLGREVDLISIEDACIEQVLPNYTEPYQGGYPMSATCTLNLMDLNPPYRSTINGSLTAKIRTGTESSGTTNNGTSGAVDTAKNPSLRPNSGGQMGRRSTTTVTKRVLRVINGQVVEDSETTIRR